MRACGKTDVGLRRHENQDTFAVEQGKKLLIAVVCDGMGGAEGGQIASSVAVETFMKEMRALIRADMTAEQLRERFPDAKVKLRENLAVLLALCRSTKDIPKLSAAIEASGAPVHHLVQTPPGAMFCVNDSQYEQALRAAYGAAFA